MFRLGANTELDANHTAKYVDISAICDKMKINGMKRNITALRITAAQ